MPGFKMGYVRRKQRKPRVKQPTKYQVKKAESAENAENDLLLLYAEASTLVGDDIARELFTPIMVTRLQQMNLLHRGSEIISGIEVPDVPEQEVFDRDAESRMKARLRDEANNPNLPNDYLKGSIRKEDWLPYKDYLYNCDPGFVQWILSFEHGFSNAIPYDKFQLYCQQAQDWIDEKSSFADCTTHEERLDFVATEIIRTRENSLYYVMKYGKMKEAELVEGYRWFSNPYPCQKMVAYLIDCGYSPLIGKCRQIGFSTIIGYILKLKVEMNYNFFVKFITYDGDTARSIFEDKIKFAATETPAWLSATVSNDNLNELKFSDQKDKGRKGAGLRKITCETATVTAINGGTPNIVAVDEAAFIPILQAMMNEARPTMYWNNPKTGKREMKRQVIMWATGGKVVTDEYETLFRNALEQWKSGKFEGAFIPVFVDFYSNPANTPELYESERVYYYSQTGSDAESSKTQFHAANPLTIDDMFLKSTATLLPIFTINKHITRISDFTKTNQSIKPIYGYFEPVYDFSRPNIAGSGFEYAIKDVNWVPSSIRLEKGEDGTYSTLTPPVQMLPVLPDLRWNYRYFQGTDPINTELGKSMFSSSVWDSYLKAPVCIINYRVADYKECYRQAVLMNLYYGGCPHLIEYNIGTNLIDFIEALGYGGTLMMNIELPVMFRINGSRIGISNKVHIRPRVIEAMRNLFEEYGDGIWFDEPFHQLKTFVEKNNAKTGATKWDRQNTKTHFDDVLFSVTYSKVAADVYQSAGLYPVNPEENRANVKPRRRLKRGSDMCLYYENDTPKPVFQNEGAKFPAHLQIGRLL